MNQNYRNNEQIKQEVDKHLHKMAVIFANTGKDSTFKEMRNAYLEEDKLINEIAKVDLEFSKVIRPYKDEQWKKNTMR